jgi:long-chain acyl-CoA synthetase
MIQNLYQHFAALAKEHGTKEALLSCTSEGEVQKAYTFLQAKDAVERIAWWLKKDLNLASQDVISLAFKNSTDFLLVSWAAWSLGIITVPLDTKSDSTKEHLYKIQLAKTKAVLEKDAAFSFKDTQEISRTVRIVEMPEIETLKNVGEDLAFKQGIGHTALILFTSGTTAKPKGVKLTLENLLVNAQGIKDWFAITEKDRFLVLLPLYHINSTTFSLASLLAGASIAVSPAYSNSKFWQQAAKTKSTFTSIVQTICYDQLSRTKEFKEVQEEVQLTRIQIGSAPVVAPDAKAFTKQFNIPLYQGYGQTETALRVTGVPMNLEKSVYEQLVLQNSIGKAMAWADVKILLKEGEFAKEGEEGEIAVKGAAVMKGYIENQEANDKAFKDGYFLTGDLGYCKVIAGERYFFLKGRIKEIIIKGGVNLSPVAIENGLKNMCSVLDQVFVIGVPDKRYGEEVAALAVYKKSVKTKEELAAQLKDQLQEPFADLAPFERPKYIAEIIPGQIPITSTGKVRRQVLKDVIPFSSFEKVNEVARNTMYSFSRLGKEESVYFKQALALYNHCWHPLSIDEKTFASQVQNGVVAVAVDKQDKVQGLLTFLRTSKTQQELSAITYKDLTGNLSLNTNDSQGDKIVCVSICSSVAQKADVIEDMPVLAPTTKEVEEYLESGKDLVYNFHQKPKGGLPGAELVALLPNARSEDILSLGYAMLVKYPALPQGRVIVPHANSSVAVQLIEAGMEFARQRGITELYAFSRPSGAYHYFTKKTR